jgi:hypothetical protein
MKRIVRLKIDVTKIDKARLFVGTKGTYLDATVFLDDEEGRYGDNGMITQDVSQQERESGTKGAILGNATIIKVLDDRPQGNQHQSGGHPMPQGAGDGPNNETEDIPFSCFDRDGIY